MKKAAIHDALIRHFEEEIAVFMRSAQAAYENATHEDSKAENKYDTRGLEASYMASSQSKRVLEAQQTLKILRDMPVRTYGEDDVIGMGALVNLEEDEVYVSYFLSPRGGGTRIDVEGNPILVITAASPLGKALMGSEVGDEVQIGAHHYIVAGLS